jgi:hypothetical protein
MIIIYHVGVTSFTILFYLSLFTILFWALTPMANLRSASNLHLHPHMSPCGNDDC